MRISHTKAYAVVVSPFVGCGSRYIYIYNRRVVTMIPRSAERVDVVVRAGAFDQLFTSCGFLTERSAQASLVGLKYNQKRFGDAFFVQYLSSTRVAF